MQNSKRINKILSVVIFICFLTLCTIGLYSTILANISVQVDKQIVFEGAYNGTTVESFEENSQVLKEYDHSEIKFFSQEPEELGLLDLDRPTPNDTIEVAQNKVAIMRESAKNIIVNHNLKILDELEDVAPKENFIVEEFCPVVKLQVSANYLSNKNINKLNYILQQSKSIEDIYISELSSQESIELANALPAINVQNMVNSGIYAGSRINVGIADAGKIRPQLYPYDYGGRDITLIGVNSYNEHSDQVAMIAAGNNGIAHRSNIISTIGSPNNNHYLTEIINNNVNVVNLSLGDKSSSAGTYTSVSKELDSIIRNSFITMVGSAGNENSSNEHYITSPKTAYNAITVGATDTANGNKVITDYSCYNEKYGISKPNICAPGFVVTSAYNQQGDEGTSYAAPQVTGCIALLMQEFPYLVAYPELCLSIVTAAASPMSTTYNTTTDTNPENHFDASGLHNQIGSGLLNYEQMRVAARNYLSITRKANSPSGMLSESLTFTATKNQRVRASLAWLAQGQDENNITDYDLLLQKVNQDGTVNTLMRINGSTNNVEFLDYSFEFDGTYRLSINQFRNNTKKDFIGMSYVLIDQSIGGSTSGGIPTTSHSEICPTDYGFDNEYNFNEITKSITTATGDVINTKSLRCGYISNTYLAMSAKRNNAGLAYLEYETASNIYGIKYDLALWSDNESLIQNSSIRLEAKDTLGQWQIIRIFNPKEMSTNKDVLLTYYDIIPYSTKNIRFIVETNQVQNENNRGRVVIGNIDIVQIK